MAQNIMPCFNIFFFINSRFLNTTRRALKCAAGIKKIPKLGFALIYQIWLLINQFWLNYHHLTHKALETPRRKVAPLQLVHVLVKLRLQAQVLEYSTQDHKLKESVLVVVELEPRKFHSSVFATVRPEEKVQHPVCAPTY